jgi:hypothetical protein
MNRHRFDHLQPTGKLLRSHSDEKKKNTTTTDRLIQEEASKFCEKSKWFTFNIVVIYAIQPQLHPQPLGKCKLSAQFKRKSVEVDQSHTQLAITTCHHHINQKRKSKFLEKRCVLPFSIVLMQYNHSYIRSHLPNANYLHGLKGNQWKSAKGIPNLL